MSKPQYKIRLFDAGSWKKNHKQFKKCLDKLKKLGYTSSVTPYYSQYIYTYADGRIAFDYFMNDMSWAKDNAPDDTLNYFNRSNKTEISIARLIEI